MIIFFALILTIVTASTASAATPTSTPEGRLDYRKDGVNYVLLIHAGQKVMETLSAFEAKENIQGANFNAIGAVQNVEVSVYDLKKKAYANKKFAASGEVVSLTGSLTRFEDKPAIHAHIAIAGPDFKVFGGHLQEAEVSMILEVFVTPTNGKLTRTLSDFPGTKFIDLSK